VAGRGYASASTGISETMYTQQRQRKAGEEPKKIHREKINNNFFRMNEAYVEL
jgi:hypothetical protein